MSFECRWTVKLRETATGRTYKTYHGPGISQYTKSKRSALSLHAQSAHANDSRAAAAAAGSLRSSGPPSRPAGKKRPASAQAGGARLGLIREGEESGVRREAERGMPKRGAAAPALTPTLTLPLALALTCCRALVFTRGRAACGVAHGRVLCIRRRRVRHTGLEP